MPASPDLAIPLRNAIIANSNIMGNLPLYTTGDDNVFTSRPVPADAPYPMIVISPDLSRTDMGGLRDERYISMRDVTVYGQTQPLSQGVSQYRLVETIAFLLFDLFHRNQKAIVVPSWKVVQIWGSGPSPAPTDDDMTVGRIVSLRIELNAAMP